MQNKPNFRKSQMNVNIYNTKNYENKSNWTIGENKPNSNPIKPNLRKAQMNVNSVISKDYRKKDDFVVRINKPNSNPIFSKPKVNANAFSQKDYENETALRPQKNKPNQSQFQTQRLREYEWFSKKGTRNFYAIRRARGPKGSKSATIYMHHELIDVGDGLLIDHVNQDSMDNRRANLRGATRAQNIRNRKKFSNSSGSKYKGIYWRKKTRKWEVQITFERKKIFLGCFRSEIDAAKAYDSAAIKYHGEFASLNFPQSGNGSH